MASSKSMAKGSAGSMAATSTAPSTRAKDKDMEEPAAKRPKKTPIDKARADPALILQCARPGFWGSVPGLIAYSDLILPLFSSYLALVRCLFGPSALFVRGVNVWGQG